MKSDTEYLSNIHGILAIIKKKKAIIKTKNRKKSKF